MKRDNEVIAGCFDSIIVVLALMLAVLVMVLCFTVGCNVTTQVRPWFAKPPAEPPAVQPAPQPPPPPKDDWAPPWFHRPKSVASLQLTLVGYPLKVTGADFENDQWQQAMVAASENTSGIIRDPSAALTIAAQRHAEHLARRDYSIHSKPGFAHDGYGDGTPEQRARAAGFTGSLVTSSGAGGEVVGPSTSGELYGQYGIFPGWLNSAGHRQALLYRGFNVCGFGHATNRYGHVFVGLYGTEHPPVEQSR